MAAHRLKTGVKNLLAPKAHLKVCTTSMSLKEFLSAVYVPRKLGLQVSAIKQICWAINSIEKWAKRPLFLHDFTNSLICRWLSARLVQVGRSTVKRERKDILALWRFARRPTFCREPWARSLNRDELDVPTIALPRRLPKAMPVTDLEAILSAAECLTGLLPSASIRWGLWSTSLLLVMYESGARIAALLSVRGADIDLRGKTLRLRWESSKTKCEQVIPLSDQAIGLISTLLRESKRLKSETLWPWPFHRRQIWYWLKGLAKSAGVTLEKYQAFHSVRKTNATVMTAFAGIDAAARQLGHTSPAMTLARYVDPVLLRELQGPQVSVIPPLKFRSCENVPA